MKLLEEYLYLSEKQLFGYNFVQSSSLRNLLEKLNLGSSSGKAKVLGTLVGIGGAMLLTLYKGVEINIWSTHVDFLNHGQHNLNHVVSTNKDEYGNRVLGCFFSVASSTCYSIWLIIQTKMSKDYPCFYSSTALMSLMALLQTVIYALSTERDLNHWKLGWNIRLLTATYSGTVASGLMVTLISWCVSLRGPVFVSIFNPLLLVLVAMAGSLILDEKLHLGSIELAVEVAIYKKHDPSVLGGVLIVCGLYLVLWGIRKEMKKLKLAPTSNTFGDQSASIDIVVLAPTTNIPTNS
ncbi:hypothetical protein F8388_010556 [Cannabis sativa]|uniref:WAT1-related protein n=1 Tax=Cannabis sativa TaxID=3483 RepID=A0A7J6GQC8_CANSA|nr:hypothetical protein F8388_010556 [Cannabis sativa]